MEALTLRVATGFITWLYEYLLDEVADGDPQKISEATKATYLAAISGFFEYLVIEAQLLPLTIDEYDTLRKALVRAADDPGEMIDAFTCSVEQESRLAETVYSVEAVAEDLVNFARLVSILDLRGAVEDDRTREVRAGVKQLASYLLGGERYTHARAAKADAARAAFCAGLVRQGLADRRLWEAVRRVADREVARLPELLETVDPMGE